MPTISCATCNEPIPSTRRADAIYCSHHCASLGATAKLHQRQRKAKGMTLLPVGTVGALHELAASIDLMRRGYHVFRAMSPSAPCDLVIYRNGETPIRVEVRTASRRVDGSIYRYEVPSELGKYDVRALVAHDGEILYVPDII